CPQVVRCESRVRQIEKQIVNFTRQLGSKFLPRGRSSGEANIHSFVRAKSQAFAAAALLEKILLGKMTCDRTKEISARHVESRKTPIANVQTWPSPSAFH